MTPTTRIACALAACLALGHAALAADAASPAVDAAAPKKAKATKKKPTKPSKEVLDQVVAQKLVQLPPASDEQFDAARRAHLGRYVCEFGQTIVLDGNDTNPGYLNLRYKSQVWVLKPVLSSTGALRLEDVKGQALLLQIAFKSMLLNTKTGQRIVDQCVHEVQKAAEEAAKNSPPPPALIN
ncbi:MAG: hypothetical protein EPO01_04950 [Aquabacterium sp.]|nr:MAG: hypothetical protein EPO01_04950 [Aquabacterium sp.]